MAEPPPAPPEQLKLHQDCRHYGYLNRESSGLPGMDDAANFRAMQVLLAATLRGPGRHHTLPKTPWG